MLGTKAQAIAGREATKKRFPYTGGTGKKSSLGRSQESATEWLSMVTITSSEMLYFRHS